MNFLSQDEDLQQHKILYNPPNKFIRVVELRYRKTDDTLIIAMAEIVEVKRTS